MPRLPRVDAACAVVSDPPLPRIEESPVYWITPEQGKAVKEFVQAGGGALFYHNTTYISPHNEDFRDVLGAVTRAAPAAAPVQGEDRES